MSTKKTYTSEFKQEAVRLAQQSRNTSEAARNLGVTSSVLRRWKKELAQDGEQAFPGKGHVKDEEINQLKRENQRLKETVEILKKALTFFYRLQQNWNDNFTFARWISI